MKLRILPTFELNHEKMGGEIMCFMLEQCLDDSNSDVNCEIY